MAFTQKTWKDRLTEYPTRRKLTQTDGTSVIVDVARLEGTISQEGDAFSAENMNNLEERIADGFSSMEELLYAVNVYKKRAELGINFAGASVDTSGEIAKYCDEYLVSTWTSSNQTISNSGLDFSKYDYVTIALVNTGSANDIFDMRTIPVAALKATGTNFLVTHGNASAYGYVYFKYVSDTSFAVKRTGATTSQLKLVGWLKPEYVAK